MSLFGKTVLITGSAHRVGKVMALAVAQAGGDVIIHHAHSADQARQTQKEIEGLGRRAAVLEADLSDPRTAFELIEKSWNFNPLFALVNSAAIFSAAAEAIN